MTLVISVLLASVMFSNTEGVCKATPEMRALAASKGYTFLGERESPSPGGGWGRTGVVCGDVNADGEQELCAILARKKYEWQVGCFIEQGDRLRFQLLRTSQDAPEGATPLTAEAYSLDIAPKGSKFEWGNGAVRVRLLRDCVEFGVEEAGERMYCYNGAVFLEMQLSD